MNNISSNGMVNLDILRTVPDSLMKEKYELVNGDVLVCTTNSANLVGKSAVFSLVIKVFIISYNLPAIT